MKEVSNLKERLREQRPASWETLPDIPLYMDQQKMPSRHL